jgi:hypothetical protein
VEVEDQVQLAHIAKVPVKGLGVRLPMHLSTEVGASYVGNSQQLYWCDASQAPLT